MAVVARAAARGSKLLEKKKNVQALTLFRATATSLLDSLAAVEGDASAAAIHATITKMLAGSAGLGELVGYGGCGHGKMSGLLHVELGRKNHRSRPRATHISEALSPLHTLPIRRLAQVSPRAPVSSRPASTRS